MVGLKDPGGGGYAWNKHERVAAQKVLLQPNHDRENSCQGEDLEIPSTQRQRGHNDNLLVIKMPTAYSPN